MPIEHGPNPKERESNEGRFRISAESVPSDEHPNRNEDAFVANAEHGVFGVFDGMTIPPGGERASAAAGSTTFKKLADLPVAMSTSEAEKAVATALQRANEAVIEEHKKGQRFRVGTTASVVLVRHDQDGRDFAAIGNAADSRVWILHNGVLEQVTTDNVSAATADQ